MRHNCKGAAPIGMDNVVVSYDTPLHLYHMFSIIQMMKKIYVSSEKKQYVLLCWNCNFNSGTTMKSIMQD